MAVNTESSATLSGVINLAKPPGLTSAKTLYRVRKLTRQRKSGHAGTLDRMAEGVLLICLGKATRLVERLMDQPKAYRATARLDVSSDSFDADEPLRPAIPEGAFIPPDRARLLDVLRGFEGLVDQVPPQLSAVKVGGRPAHRHAREGVTLALRPRRVRIDWIVLHRYDWPELDFEMACGRGTYVRALIRDVGLRLGVGGCLTRLVRTRVGPFALHDAWTLDRLADADPHDFLHDVKTISHRLETGRPEPITRPC